MASLAVLARIVALTHKEHWRPSHPVCPSRPFRPAKLCNNRPNWGLLIRRRPVYIKFDVNVGFIERFCQVQWEGVAYEMAAGLHQI